MLRIQDPDQDPHQNVKKKSQKSKKQCFSPTFRLLIEGSGSRSGARSIHLTKIDPDPDPGGQKTRGSGSATLILTIPGYSLIFISSGRLIGSQTSWRCPLPGKSEAKGGHLGRNRHKAGSKQGWQQSNKGGKEGEGNLYRQCRKVQLNRNRAAAGTWPHTGRLGHWRNASNSTA